MGWEGVGGRCCSWSLGQLGRGRGEGVRGQGLPPGRTAPALPAGRGYLVCCCPWATRFAIWGRRAWKGRVALPAPRSQELCVGCLRALPPGQWPPIWELSGWAPGFPRLQSQLPRCWGGGILQPVGLPWPGKELGPLFEEQCTWKLAKREGGGLQRKPFPDLQPLKACGSWEVAQSPLNLNIVLLGGHGPGSGCGPGLLGSLHVPVCPPSRAGGVA